MQEKKVGYHKLFGNELLNIAQNKIEKLENMMSLKVEV